MAKAKNIGFKELDIKLDRVIDAMATQDDVRSINARINVLEEKFEKRFQDVLVAIDKLATTIGKLNLEYAAISAKLSRYDEWFKILAKKTGVKLPI